MRRLATACRPPCNIGDVLRERFVLPLAFRDGDHRAQFSTGEGSIAVASSRESLGAAPGSQGLVLAVNDLDAMLSRLRELGARVGTVRDRGEHGRTALVQSPGGTTLALFST